MDNTKLLQDITYYSRIIRERTKQKEKYKFAQINPIYSQKPNWNTILPLTKTKYNCYKYVKTNNNSKKLIEPIKTTSQPVFIPKQNKVLINPHFKSQSINNSHPVKVHVNPNFNSNRINNTVHINRLTEFGDKILKEQNHRLTTQNLTKPTQTHLNIHLKQPAIIQTNLKLIKRPSIVQTNLNLIKKSPTVQINKQPSIIKHTPIKQSLKSSSECFKSKYKLDRRRTNSLTRKRKYSYSTALKTRLKNTRSRVTVNRNTNLINISGNLYKISRNKLQKTNSNNSNSIKLNKKKHKYRYVKQTEVKKNPLVVVPSSSAIIKRKKVVKPLVGSIKLKRAIKGRISTKYKLINTSSRTSTKSKNKKLIRTLPNKYRKNNVPCPIFNRYGKCSSHDKGTCRRVHDPKLIAICKKYLQGACDIKSCTLSHNITLEKMPTCKFYLDGFCSKDQCPYLHVKLNEKTDICKDFLNGYCQAADKCDKRHVNYCPEFERTGKCSKIKCPYPHITIITSEQAKQLKLESRNKQESKTSKEKVDEIVNFEIDVTATPTPPVTCPDNKIFRYYIKEDDLNANDANFSSSSTDDGQILQTYKERTKNIETPDFIPKFNNSNTLGK
ncbi:zinc finger CCCH domain-containing protein 3 [Chrysoperla carnea]|uniref:zinc finger CCCH domain-containing protein 3 n=1 Tax=Chrysoperla carnea TaxID=189513 RepID=UPI001D061D96|nr:zinc finger CCCH domain-containing protein 3 [Chrysoperla carnea]